MNGNNERYEVIEGQCAGAAVCPLSHVEAGSTVCIKRVEASPEISSRLRELGFCEDQRVKVLSRHSNLICLVCNARLGISERLAENIFVETIPAALEVA